MWWFDLSGWINILAAILLVDCLIGWAKYCRYKQFKEWSAWAQKTTEQAAQRLAEEQSARRQSYESHVQATQEQQQSSKPQPRTIRRQRPTYEQDREAYRAQKQADDKWRRATFEWLKQHQANEQRRLEEQRRADELRQLEDRWQQRLEQERADELPPLDDAWLRRVERKRQEQQEWWAWYNAYLRTPEWKARRALVLQRDNYTCQRCHSAHAVQVHHLTYEHAGNEELSDLLSLCYDCHQQEHGRQ